MNRYAVEHYNLTHRPEPIKGRLEIDAESAFDALCRANVLPTLGTIETFSNHRIDAWEKAPFPGLAAADNRHWQRNPDKGTIGAWAYRIA